MRWRQQDRDRHPLIIAEIGASHEGRLDTCYRLIAGAKEAGCDAVKIQFFQAERLAAQRHAEHVLDTYRQFAVPREWLPAIRQEADACKLPLVISVYDAEGCAQVHPFAHVIKVASFEAGDLDFLDAIGANTTVPIIVSTGLCDHKAMMRLLAWRQFGSHPRALLHCVSAYPCPLRSAQLHQIKNYALDGFSDHTGHVLTGALAVACGASILEVHIRHAMTHHANPDFPHSLPIGVPLREYVQFARDAASAVRAPHHRYVEGIESPMLGYRTRPLS